MTELKNSKIVFDDSAKLFVLELLGKTVNEEGKVVEKGNADQKVLTFDKNELYFEEFGGVKKGSEVFIENNVVSLFKLSKEMQ